MKKLEMITGSILKKILAFSLPMILGSVFQLAYSTIDGVVIGRFVGHDALAAVGATTPIYNVLVFLLVGLCNGASILMSELHGAKRFKTLKQNMGTSISAGIILSIVLTLVFTIFSSPILQLTKVKPELLADASAYLTFASLGIAFCFIYNFYSVALRASGDSLRPLYILAASSVINIGLDFLFVGGLGMGVMGAALATVISQAFSAIACIFYAAKVDPLFRFKLGDFKIVGRQLLETSRYAIASALQQIVLFVGKSLVQVNINALSIETQAAYTACGKIDDYVTTPIQCIGNTVAIFIAQNRGAGHQERCKKGLSCGFVMSFIYTVLISIIIYFTRTYLIQLFLNPEDDIIQVVSEGSKYYTYMCFFFMFPALTNSAQSYFRGLGKLFIVFLSTSVQIVIRAAVSFVLIPYFGIQGAALCAACGWTGMILVEFPLLFYYLKTQKGLYDISKVDIVKTNNKS